MWTVFFGPRIREPKPRGFDSSIMRAVSCPRQLSFSARFGRRAPAARARAAASTRSCPPREFQEVAGTARGPALALGAEPRGLGPCEAEPPRAREPRDASCEGVVHEASMRALRDAVWVKKRASCSLARGGDASTHGQGSSAGAEERGRVGAPSVFAGGEWPVSAMLWPCEPPRMPEMGKSRPFSDESACCAGARPCVHLRSFRCSVLFGLRGAARPRARRYAIAHGIRDKVHVTNSWQSSRTCPCASL